ncbi:MAG: ClpXP protease specificity-enhancing factor SspB [Proteobacteria bacterium]|nr:ClpXP protease specificity-enhancing factor SspB [Pseudomonadota bacterium]
MSQKPTTINYEGLVEKALRRVVRDSLAIVVANGLPGNSHFYISFNTKHLGVKMADYLLTAHGDKMTIIVQHQFWDLTVRDNDFDITLSFNHRPEVLTIPFAAITEFSDPAAGFALQFTPMVANKNNRQTSGEKSAKPARVESLRKPNNMSTKTPAKPLSKTLANSPKTQPKPPAKTSAVAAEKIAMPIKPPLKPIALPKNAKTGNTSPSQRYRQGNSADVVELDSFRKKP